MARARMIVLYDQSVDFNGLVIGTSNKTEILLGYSTLYGDSACALNPIGDLYKTQVRQLSREIGVPSVILEKPPSADRYRPEDLVEAGFDVLFVREVIDRIRRSQYKRVLPPVAKLSNRTVGYDFLYLRDWGT